MLLKKVHPGKPYIGLPRKAAPAITKHVISFTFRGHVYCQCVAQGVFRPAPIHTYIAAARNALLHVGD